jgi:hypothetical protein
VPWLNPLDAADATFQELETNCSLAFVASALLVAIRALRYFIPEDGDSEAFPNVFLAPKPRQPGYPPTLGEIKNSFPLPGRYHFRFKSPLVPGSDRDRGSMAVWLDCADDAQAVPTWKSGIVAKVTRIGLEDEDDDDDDADFAPSPAPSSQAVPGSAPSRPHHQHSQSNGSTPSLDIFDGPTPSIHNQHSLSAPPSTGSLLDGHAPVTASGVKDSLLDMSAPVFSGNSTSPAHADFFGMTATESVSPPSRNPVPPMQAPQQAPMSGGYASQQQRQTQYGMPSSQQQRPPSNQAFNSFSQQSGPFGDLGTPWK